MKDSQKDFSNSRHAHKNFIGSKMVFLFYINYIKYIYWLFSILRNIGSKYRYIENIVYLGNFNTWAKTIAYFA